MSKNRARGLIHVGNEHGACELVHFTASVAYVVANVPVSTGTYARVSITPPDQPPVDFDGVVHGVGAQDGQQMLELRLHEPGSLAVEVLSRLLGGTQSHEAIRAIRSDPVAAGASASASAASAAAALSAAPSAARPGASSAPASLPGPPPGLPSLDARSAAAALDDHAPALDVRIVAVFLGRRLIALHPLGRTVTTIGRSSESAIVLDDATVSRRHCRIVRRDEECWIVDEGAANRTLLNNGPVTRAQLAPGDEITLGKFLLIFMPTRRQLARAGVDPLPRDGNSREQTHPLDEAELLRIWQRVADERRAHLRLLDDRGVETGEPILLSTKRLVLGAGEDVDVPLAGWDEVPTQHAALVAVPAGRRQQHRLEVTGSTDGVTVNGKPLRRSPVLANEDVIAFGPLRLRYYQSAERVRRTDAE